MTTLSVVPNFQPIKRWTMAEKARLLDLLLSYQVTIEEVLDFYPNLTTAELLEWKRLYAEHGHAGLRSTRLQTYREIPLKKAA